MKAEVIKPYRDIELNKIVLKGEIMDISETRAEKLKSMGLVKVIEEEKPTESEKPRKKRAKKEA